MVRNLKNEKGFTLVELLVVVAIIGILATAGIPQYRRMVQKSKKSEAKVMLGDIANAEAAFFSEFGAYGNNLSSMGVEGTSATAVGIAQQIYMSGFMGADCAIISTVGVPGSATVWGAQVLAQNPGYYPAGGLTQANLMFGRTTRTTLCRVAIQPAAGNNFATYTASASGVIQTGANLDSGANGTGNIIDAWTINQDRILSNVLDGIN